MNNTQRWALPSSEFFSSVPSASNPLASGSSDSSSETERRIVAPISKWPSHLAIVRHAESQGNVLKGVVTAERGLVYGGKVREMDVPLTANGEEQAVAT